MSLLAKNRVTAIKLNKIKMEEMRHKAWEHLNLIEN